MTDKVLGEVWGSGHSGADIAGLHAANAAGLTTAGYFLGSLQPKTSPLLDCANRYGLKALSSQCSDSECARLNIISSDGTLIVEVSHQRGAQSPASVMCESANRAYIVVTMDQIRWPRSVERMADWLRTHKIHRLNITGALDVPEVEVEQWLRSLFLLAKNS